MVNTFRATSLVTAVLIAVFVGVSCSDNQTQPKGQTLAGETNPRSSKQPLPPNAVVKIVFDMGQAAGPGLDVYKGDFKPQEMYIKAGTIVTWQNNEDFLLNNHRVISSDGLFEEELGLGESFNYTFTKEGTYEYYCKAFPIMTGKIFVE